MPAGLEPRRFGRIVGIDWSGAATARPGGIAVAVAGPGDGAPLLVTRRRGWSRGAVLAWLARAAATRADVLVGFDASFALPFADRGTYFPGEPWSPRDAPALWAQVDAVCAGDPHLAATAFPRMAAAHYRRQEARIVLTGAAFAGPSGRLRVTERLTRARRLGNAVSSFNLIGAGQVGRASLTAMRLLHRLRGRVPVWPFDPVPAAGPLLVEVYSATAAVAAGLTPGRSKVRDPASLATALSALGSATPALGPVDDHAADALLIAAWLRRAHTDAALWAPAPLDAALASTEGWTFGVA